MSRRLRSDADADFESPDRSQNQTSYNLSYSHENTRLRSSNLPLTELSNLSINRNGPSTSRAAAALSTQNYYARKSTTVGSRGRLLPIEESPRRNAPSSRNVRRRKQMNPQQFGKEMRFLRTMRALQNQEGSMIPKLPFGRLVREIIYNCNQDVNRVTKDAFDALQEATEMYMTQVFNDAYMLTLHRKRVTLSVEDFEILRLFKMIE